MTTDILVTSYNRGEYLERTVHRINGATTSPYRIHVIDDGSENQTLVSIEALWDNRLIHTAVLSRIHRGVRPNLNIGTWLTFSDPIIYADDDVLCPKVDPDWLSQLVAEMDRHPELAMLALHHPGAKNKPRGESGRVVYCESLGGMFVAIRRKFLLENPFPHDLSGTGQPMAWRCERALSLGWKIGYVKGLYCYHFGVNSVMTGSKYAGSFIEPKDWDTLEP